jgi:hypothetical protein
MEPRVLNDEYWVKKSMSYSLLRLHAQSSASECGKSSKCWRSERSILKEAKVVSAATITLSVSGSIKNRLASKAA